MGPEKFVFRPLPSSSSSSSRYSTPRDAAAFGLSIFENSYQYAPLLVIDGPGGALPHNYLDPKLLFADVPTIVGVTRQEADFGRVRSTLVVGANHHHRKPTHHYHPHQPRRTTSET